MSPAKCIDCKKPFNRLAATDKLRCPDCTKENQQHSEPWKNKLKKIKVKD